MSGHPLDVVLSTNSMGGGFAYPGGYERFADLGKLALWVGNAVSTRAPSMLEATVDISMGWLVVLGVDDPGEALRHEYDLAVIKHPGMTLDADGPTDQQRAAALVEELGEVARALTYDRDQAGALAPELAQLGALAAAWIVHFEKVGA